MEYLQQGYFPFVGKREGHPRSPIMGFNNLAIANTRKEFNDNTGQYKGYYTTTGRIYLFCPFHLERTPSLLVTFSKEIEEFNFGTKEWVTLYADTRFNKWKCFGCGAGGSNLYYLLDCLKGPYHSEYHSFYFKREKEYYDSLKNVVDNEDIPF